MNVPAGTVSSPTPDPTAPDPTNPTPTLDPKPDEEDDPKPDEPKSLVEGDPKPEPKGEPEPFVPLTVEDITISEGLELSETARDEALAIINNRELSPKEQLQAFADLQGKLAKEASDTISETWTNTQKEWQDEVKADPAIGGDKLPATLSAVNKLVTEYGDDKLIEVFAMTGAGNNVHVIKFLNSIAGKLLEGGIVSATSPTNQDSSAAERLFPSMKKG